MGMAILLKPIFCQLHGRRGEGDHWFVFRAGHSIRLENIMVEASIYCDKTHFVVDRAVSHNIYVQYKSVNHMLKIIKQSCSTMRHHFGGHGLVIVKDSGLNPLSWQYPPYGLERYND